MLASRATDHYVSVKRPQRNLIAIIWTNLQNATDISLYELHESR